MEFTGEITMDATPEDVWAIITDPEELTRCVPGAQDVERVDNDTYKGTISRSVAGFTLNLDGELQILEEDPYERMAAEIRAGNDSAGSWTKATANAEMELTSSGDETTIAYTVTADVKGRLSSLGSTLVEPLIKSDIEAYFAAIAERAQAR